MTTRSQGSTITGASTPGDGNRLSDGMPPPLEVIERVDLDNIVCHERLGGLLAHYKPVSAYRTAVVIPEGV